MRSRSACAMSWQRRGVRQGRGEDRPDTPTSRRRVPATKSPADCVKEVGRSRAWRADHHIADAIAVDVAAAQIAATDCEVGVP